MTVDLLTDKSLSVEECVRLSEECVANHTVGTDMTILGPARPASQVEISLSDARTLGVKAPVRESGDIAGTPGCTIKVGENTVEIAVGI